MLIAYFMIISDQHSIYPNLFQYQNELNYYILKDIHSSINIVLAIIFIILIIENYL